MIRLYIYNISNKKVLYGLKNYCKIDQKTQKLKKLSLKIANQRVF